MKASIETVVPAAGLSPIVASWPTTCVRRPVRTPASAARPRRPQQKAWVGCRTRVRGEIWVSLRTGDAVGRRLDWIGSALNLGAPQRRMGAVGVSCIRGGGLSKIVTVRRSALCRAAAS